MPTRGSSRGLDQLLFVCSPEQETEVVSDFIKHQHHKVPF